MRNGAEHFSQKQISYVQHVVIFYIVLHDHFFKIQISFIELNGNVAHNQTTALKTTTKTITIIIDFVYIFEFIQCPLQFTSSIFSSVCDRICGAIRFFTMIYWLNNLILVKLILLHSIYNNYLSSFINIYYCLYIIYIIR